MFKNSIVKFRFNYLDIRFIHLVNFDSILNRIYNLGNFQIRCNIRYLEFWVLQVTLALRA